MNELCLFYGISHFWCLLRGQHYIFFVTIWSNFVFNSIPYRYKQDLTPEQKDAILDLLKFKTHELITPEIRREIVNSVARGEMVVDLEMEDA